MAASHIFANLVLICFVGMTLADWTNIDEPFENANTVDVVFTESSKTATRIQFKEERTTDTKIAIMHYDDEGSEEGPTITRFEDGKTNAMLGAIAVKESGVWYLVITKQQDYENPNERSYTFLYDIGGQGHRVELLIENINDMTPRITATQSECKIKENEVLPESVCTFTVIDEDGSVDNMVYSISDSGVSSALFHIVTLDESGGTAKIALSVAAPGLDFETFSLHILNIYAQDSPVNGNIGSTSYVVQVEDEADTPPVWKTPIVPQTIIEGMETTIQVTAADGDIGINGEIDYAIEFTIPDDGKFFSIDSNGLITVAEIDRDVLASDIFQFDVVAFEKDETSSRIKSSMFVIIQDVNDNEPVINANTFTVSIPEETPMQLNLGIVITDPDLADFGQFKIELQDKSGKNASAHFLLIPTTGYQRSDVTISVRNAAALDFEDPEMQVITLQIVAAEIKDSSRFDTKDIVITLLPVNDEFPEFDKEEYTATIKENAKKGTSVTTVMATDPDKGDVVKHSLTSQLSTLVINETTGEITVAADNVFDFERQIDIIVQVLAEDEVGHKTYVQLAITIIDVNDTPPTIEMPTTQTSVTENELIGTTIDANISASDVDFDAKLTFKIDWTSSYATKQGARVQTDTLYKLCVDITTIYPDSENTKKANGVIKVTENKLDYESFDTLALSIVVTDENTLDEFPLSKTRSALLSLVILDENDNPPKFTLDSQSAYRSVIEGSITGQLIGSVIATDADGPGNNDIEYSIKEDDSNLPEYLVMIDPVKGELRVNQTGVIDCDTVYKDKMKYIVTASDGNDETTLKITIDIIDQNDNVPEYDLTGFIITIPENSETGTAITVVKAQDKDFSVPFKTISYFINYNEDQRLADLFNLDEITGALTVKLNDAINAVLDRDEGTTFYDIPVIYRDNYNQGSNSAISLFNDTKIRLNLADENDNAPEFPVITSCLVSPLESTLAGEFIYRGLYAPDKDYGENATVTYSVVSYVRIADGFTVELPENMFEIETTSDFKGDIKVTTVLTDLWGNYNLELRADDNGPSGSNKSSSATYKICILDINDNDPVIEYPAPEDVLRLREEQIVGGPLIDSKNKSVTLFTATDADFAENADVEFRLTGTPSAMAYFELVNRIDGKQNTAQLQLIQDLDPGTTLFKLSINATDNGKPPRSSSVQITVVIIKVTDVEPEFQQKTWDVIFMENSESETSTIDPIAVDRNNDLIDASSPEWQTVYYYIIDDGSAGVNFFDLNKITGTLTLTKALDREEYDSHTLQVLTTNSNVRPNIAVDTESLSQLTLFVEVGDENDCPPVFDVDLWPGGISTGDKNGQVILKINADDPDVNDVVSYRLLKDSMIADPSLDLIKDNAFDLIPTTGELKLNFDPDSKMTGFFQFQVEASDKIGGENHVANASVKIFIIADSNRVTFKFLNDKTEIDAQKISVSQIFTEVIGFDCAIDTVVRSTDDTGIIIEDETQVTTHFIDGVENRPVDNSEITNIVNNRDKMTEMKRAFFNLEPYPLELADYDAGTPTIVKSQEALLRIILIVVSVVLGLLVILLFAAFFIKTRSLNRRLEALSTTKFGSQDSGLNRVGMNVPGANKHAIEGSNPVWKEDINTKDLDNISQDSEDDSDLIGIEENPEFNTMASSKGGNVNFSYSPDAGRRISVVARSTLPSTIQDVDRRQSVNPLSNGGAPRGMSHQMSIESDNSNDDYGDTPTIAANSNFTFAKKVNDVPTTEL